MKRVVFGLAIISLTLLVLFVGCAGIVTEQEAIKIAEDIILQDFPDMVDATRTLESYTSEGKEFYEITYSKTVGVESEGEIVELPQIVSVIIDKNTREQFVEVSD